MTHIFNFLARPWVFAVSVLVLAVFMATILPAKAADAALYTPAGASFDTSFFYTPAQAIERVGLYSPEGRAAYVYDRWTFDLAWPFVYGFFLLSGWACGLSRLMPAGGMENTVGYRWLMIPVLAVVFDFVENTAVTILMLAYPATPLVAAVVASMGTLIKWVFVMIGMSGAVGLPVAGGIAVLLRQRGSSRS